MKEWDGKIETFRICQQFNLQKKLEHKNIPT